MQLKKGILWLVILAGATVLAACNQQAPNLSFEETVKAYGDQRASILSILDLISDKEAIFSSKLNGVINLELGTGEVGKIVVNSTNVSESRIRCESSVRTFFSGSINGNCGWFDSRPWCKGIDQGLYSVFSAFKAWY